MILKCISVFMAVQLLCAGPLCGQIKDKPAKVQICQYKDNAKGVYTIIHDDFGGSWVHGIEDYADTMAYNRGIPFCFALIAGQCDELDWEIANRMIQHGHQVVNHSMNHKCGVESSWCTAGNWNEKDFYLEIDSSSALIKRQTGKPSAFFMFPFDLHTDTMISYLQHQGFAGARAGQYQLENLQTVDPFHLNFLAFQPGYTQGNLDSFALRAMEERAWAIREVHGVEDESWGMIPLKTYENHLNNLQRWQKDHSLWVATLSDVLFYKKMNELYKLQWYYDPAMRIHKIDFLKRKGSLKKEWEKTYSTLQATATNKMLTLILLPQGKVSDIQQNGKSISFRKETEKIIFDVDPAMGIVEIFYK